MTRRASISDIRSLARSWPPDDPLGLAALGVIEGAESLRRLHAAECGCEFPGTSICLWPRPEGQLLDSFDFDEEVIDP